MTIHLHQGVFGREHLQKMIINHLNTYTGAPSVKFYINAVHNYFRALDERLYNKCFKIDEHKISKLEHIFSYRGNKLDVVTLEHYAGTLMKTKFATLYLAKSRLKTCKIGDGVISMPSGIYKAVDNRDIVSTIIQELPKLISIGGKLCDVNPLLNKRAWYVPQSFIEAAGYATVGQFQIKLESLKDQYVIIRIEHMISHALMNEKFIKNRDTIVDAILKAFSLMPCIKEPELMIDKPSMAKIYFEIATNKPKEKNLNDLDKMFDAKVKLRDQLKKQLDELNEEKVSLETLMDETVNWLIEADLVKDKMRKLLEN